MTSISYASATVLRYRWLLYELALRDLKLRYRNSLLGFAWTILNPVLFMLLYILVFSVYLRVSLPNFPLYVLAGVVPWNWVTGAVPPATTAIQDGRMYVGKAVFPIELLVLVPVISNGVNFGLSLILTLAAIPFLGGHFGDADLSLPFVILGELLLITGISFVVATFNAFYRDLQQLVMYLLMGFFFLTPIFYASTSVPAHLKFLVQWNPFAAMIGSYHKILYENAFPTAWDMGFMYASGFVLLLVGIKYFDRFRDHFGDYL